MSDQHTRRKHHESSKRFIDYVDRRHDFLAGELVEQTEEKYS
jgi:hypothetical protein